MRDARCGMRGGRGGDASRIPHPASRQHLLAAGRDDRKVGGFPVVGQLTPVVRNRGADSLLIGANLRFHAASTMKLPVMIQIFRDADAGLLGLDDSLTVHTAFPSLAEGAFIVGKEDDSDSTLYSFVGRNRSVRDLLERMITRSSNLATNILIERVGAARAQASARALGAWSIQVLRGVEDGAAYRAGLNNTA